MKCFTFLAVLLVLSVSAAPSAYATGSQHPPSQYPTSHPSKPVLPPSVTQQSSIVSQQSSNVSQDSRTKSSASSQSKSQAKSSADSRSQATSGSSSNAFGGNSRSTARGGSSKVRSTTTSSLQNSGNSSVSLNVAPVNTVAPEAHAAASNGDQDVTIHGDTTNYEAPRIPVATAASGGTNTTAGCRYSVGAGGQGTFLGLSFGIGRKDRDCERVALADMMYDRGNPDAGDVIMCRVRELREAFGANCLAMLARSRPAMPTAHQLEQREAFERGDHFK